MSLIKIYNTAEKSRDQIDAQFVVRTDILSQILEDIGSSSMEFPEQDFLIIGERGMGKTMLLTKIKYAIEFDLLLQIKLIPILFPEELNGVNDLFDFWSTTIDHLADINENYIELREDIKEINGFDKDAEQILFTKLTKKLSAHKENLILLIDNIDSLFEKIGEKESKRLREILITNKRLRIIGASSKAIESTFQYDKAFYEHFAIIKLKGLSYSETVILLQKLGDVFSSEKRINNIIKEEKYRIEALRSLTGGNLRNIVMLFNILLSDTKSDPIDDLLKILEDVTPINIHKITSLKKNQRKIVDYLAMKWDAVWVKEISTDVRMKSNEVSSQLKSLEENGIVISKETNSRKKMYQIRDRFFNIWYLMRYSRKNDRNRVKWLINFYKIWCSNDDLKKKGDNLLLKISNKNCSPYTVYIETIAFLLLDDVEQNQKQMIFQNAKNYLQSEKSKYFNELQSAYDLVEKKGTNESLQELEKLVSKKNDKYITRGIYFEKVKKNFKTAESFYKKAAKTNKAESYHRLAHLYKKFKKPNWEKMFEKAIDAGSNRALICYSRIFVNRNDLKKAEGLLLDRWSFSKNKEVGLFLGNLYEDHTNEFDKAIKLYKEIHETHNEPYALHRLAHIYEEKFKDNKNAEIYFKQAIDEGEESCKNCLAWNYYRANKKKNRAIELIEEAFGSNNSPSVAHTYSTIMLWDNRITDSVETAKIFLNDISFTSNHEGETFDYLMLLMKKNLLNIADNYFQDESNNFKEQFKPLYFALMTLLRDKYPNEITRMGEELSDTVLDLLNEIKNDS